MNSRERVVTALNYEEPDRLPIDLGGTVVTSITKSTYSALRDYMKLPKVPIRTLEPAQQVAVYNTRGTRRECIERSMAELRRIEKCRKVTVHGA
jgi:hypothetical protein